MNVRVLVVDDSVVIRGLFCRELARDPEIEVVGAAGDPYEARDKILALRPDVMTLDIEMPRMDGLTFLRKLMRYQPLPVVVVSSFTDAGGEKALEALEAGAVEVLSKPSARLRLPELSIQLAEAVKGAAHARLLATGGCAPLVRGRLQAAPASGDAVVAIGASTGGPQAIQRILGELGRGAPPILIAQHMPPPFTELFAKRLEAHCDLRVEEARSGDLVEPGKVLVAPGNLHMLLKRSAGRFRVEVKDGPLVCRHRPSVDVLFSSVARSAGRAGIGVILTGMGDDGAHGLLEMAQAGAETIAQDRESCVVYGMPWKAALLGAPRHIVALEDIARRVVELAGRVGVTAVS
jgi:two-component system chemotaxis response regulator CheB